MTTPAALAAQLGVSPRTLRAWLRREWPEPHGVRWTLDAEQVARARHAFDGTSAVRGRPRGDSDEAYVLDLVDATLGEPGRRQHRFEWLVGDPGATGRRARLPVDGYWPDHAVVVEYRERQHDEPVAHWDARGTVSGMSRGEQRRRYDALREELIPAHGLRLVVIRPADLDADRQGRLRRRRDADLGAIRLLVARSPR